MAALLMAGLAMGLPCCFAQQRSAAAAGFQSDYLNDFDATRAHVVQLAEAIPAAKYAWRPRSAVRSVGEVYMHIATGNYLLLGIAGVPPPSKYYAGVSGSGKDAVHQLYEQGVKLETSVTSKDQVVQMLKDSLDAVREHLAKLTAADLDRPADFFGRKTTVRAIYLRIFAHVNEHTGQSIAYARMNGIVPPWSVAEASAK
jgi:uncharacterized damage-inducible protein DinB